MCGDRTHDKRIKSALSLLIKSIGYDQYVYNFILSSKIVARLTVDQ